MIEKDNDTTLNNFCYRSHTKYFVHTNSNINFDSSNKPDLIYVFSYSTYTKIEYRNVHLMQADSIIHVAAISILFIRHCTQLIIINNSSTDYSF